MGFSDDDDGYDSDSSFECYYLYDEEERKFMYFVDRVFEFSGEEDSDRIQIRYLERQFNNFFGWNLSNMYDVMTKESEKIKKFRLLQDLYVPMYYSCSRIHAKIYQNPLQSNDQNDNQHGDDNYQNPLHSNDQNNSTSSTPHKGKRGSRKRRKCYSPSTPLLIQDYQPETTKVIMVDDEEINPVANIHAGTPVQENIEGTNLTGSPPPRVAEASGHGNERRVYKFIRRALQNSDMDDIQSRLSMPCNQVQNQSFFTEEELEILKNGSKVAVKVIDTLNREWDTNLRLPKQGKNNYCYAIGKPWNDIKRKNGFKAGMEIDVGVSRRDSGEVCFVLEKVPRAR